MLNNVKMDFLRAVLPSAVALFVGLIGAFVSYQVMSSNIDAEVKVRYRLKVINEMTEEAPNFLAATDKVFRHYTLLLPKTCDDISSWNEKAEKLNNDIFISKYRILALLEWNQEIDININDQMISIIEFVQDRQCSLVKYLVLLCNQSVESNIKVSKCQQNEESKEIIKNTNDNYLKNYEKYNDMNNVFMEKISLWVQTKLKLAESF